MEKQISLSGQMDEWSQAWTKILALMPELLSGDKETVYGDSGYLGAEKREDAVIRNKNGKKIRYKINRHPSQFKNRSTHSKTQIKRREHEKSSVREKLSMFSL